MAEPNEPLERPSLWHSWYMRGAMAALLVVSLLGWYFTRERLPDEIVIATAAEGGQYHHLASVLKPHLERITRRPVTLLATAGSQENSELLAKGRAHLAILQGGSVPMDGLAVLAPLYYEPVHVVVRRELGMKSLRDLDGRKVALGPEGSGMRRSAQELLAHYRIDVSKLCETNCYFGDLEKRPDLDAAVVTTGLENRDLQALLATGRFELLSVLDAEALAIRHPYFAPVTIPRGLFAEGPPVPEANVPTVGTTALLASRSGESKLLVQSALEALYENHLQLALPTLISERAAMEWRLFPLHAAARGYHDPYEGLGLLANLMESIAAIKELLFALGAGLYLIWDRRQRLKELERKADVNRQKEHLDSFLNRTVSIERAHMDCTDTRRLHEYLDEVTRIKLQALEELTHEDLRGDRLFSIFLMQCANLIQKIQYKILLLQGRAPGEPDHLAARKAPSE